MTVPRLKCFLLAIGFTYAHRLANNVQYFVHEIKSRFCRMCKQRKGSTSQSIPLYQDKTVNFCNYCTFDIKISRRSISQKKLRRVTRSIQTIAGPCTLCTFHKLGLNATYDAIIFPSVKPLFRCVSFLILSEIILLHQF
mgnify:CR=1 FL=1